MALKLLRRKYEKPIQRCLLITSFLDMERKFYTPTSVLRTNNDKNHSDEIINFLRIFGVLEYGFFGISNK